MWPNAYTRPLAPVNTGYQACLPQTPKPKPKARPARCVAQRVHAAAGGGECWLVGMRDEYQCVREWSSQQMLH